MAIEEWLTVPLDHFRLPFQTAVQSYRSFEEGNIKA